MKTVKKLIMMLIGMILCMALTACSSSSKSSIANSIEVERQMNAFTLNADGYVDGEVNMLYIETIEDQDIELSYELTKGNGDIIFNIIYPSADTEELFSSLDNIESQLNLQIKKGMNIISVSGAKSEYEILLKGKGYDDSLITFLDFSSPEQQLTEN